MSTYEISILVRNAQGEVIEDKDGNYKRKTFSSDSSYKLWEFWNRNGPQTKKRKTAAAAKSKDVAKIVNQVDQYAKKVTSFKRKTDDESVQAE